VTKHATITGPPPAKQLQVCEDLREQIVAGVYPPGSRLPSVSALCRTHDVAIMTMQKALGRLKDEGVLHSIQRRGNFVSERPPHLHRIAVVYPHAPGEPGWSLFAAALLHASQQLDPAADLELVSYMGIASTEEPGAAMPQLVADIQARRLRGIFFFTHPGRLRGSPLLAPLDLPRVGVMSEAIDPSFTALTPDWGEYGRQALAHFTARGRRRLGIVATNRENNSQLASLQRLVADSAVESEPYWLQTVPWDSPEWSRNTAHAMVVHAHRPDAIIVTDDHLVEPVLAGIRDAGCLPGREVEVIAHCNFPNQPQQHTGVTYLGFDAADFLNRGIACLDDRALAGTVQQIHPIFDHEYAASTHSRGATHAL